MRMKLQTRRWGNTVAGVEGMQSQIFLGHDNERCCTFCNRDKRQGPEKSIKLETGEIIVSKYENA